MSITQELARRIIFPAFVAMQIEHLLLRLNKNRRIILCYHGVVPTPDFSINGRHLSVTQLEQHFAYLKKNFDVIPVQNLFEQKKCSYTGKPKVAITFDDGFKNNWQYALPLLEKYEIPASFYITTSCLKDRSFLTWADTLELLIRYTSQNRWEVGDFSAQKNERGSWVISNSNESIFDALKKMGSERDVLIEQLKVKYNFQGLVKKAQPAIVEMLSAEDLKQFASSPFVTIGSHTHRHYNLANIDPELAMVELTHSREQLEEILGRSVDTIAFPDGSYNNLVKKMSIDAGYRYLLAVSYKENSDKNDLSILPRFTISNTTTFESNMIRLCRSFDTSGF
jgi:peptidoglycan/xylan/chitin deacetylase (PgdA/CDA1 family)